MERSVEGYAAELKQLRLELEAKRIRRIRAACYSVAAISAAAAILVLYVLLGVK